MGVIFDIKRFAVHDGPGIRTTVFLKGCPLSCWWCHNPESIGLKPQVFTKKVRLGGKFFFDEETIGREMPVAEVMTEVLKEQLVMEESCGGVTFSGGEPMVQHLFLSDLLKQSKYEGLHTAIDTSGFVQKELFEKILPYADMFLYDLKVMEARLHLKYTGVNNHLILSNLKFLAFSGKSIRLRIPLINGINTHELNLAKTISFLKPLKDNIERIDLLPYHRIGKSKYSRFGVDYKLNGNEEVPENELSGIKTRFETEGFQVNIGG
jgi:pyruvate formate lyase activating enzyme